jgi:phosphatidylserine synthase
MSLLIRESAMSEHLVVLGEHPIRLWGLSTRERVERVLRGFGVRGPAKDLESVPDEGLVLLLRADYLYDNRVLQALLGREGVVLVAENTARTPVAAHVPRPLAGLTRDMLLGDAPANSLPELPRESSSTISSGYQERLRKFDPPFAHRVTESNRRLLERELFAAAYKGVTDLVTKFVWPLPARVATGFCVRLGLRPNHVTLVSLVLVVLAGFLFSRGQYGLGLLAAWIMTFLDTVDGKLARVTVTSTAFGHIFDHAIDLLSPPIWYIVWGLSLPGLGVGVPGLLSVKVVLWSIVVGYVAGRLVEGIFKQCLGRFGVFCWRPTDSYFRLITARRNPNLILLSVAALLGRPDVGLLAVALWTVATSLFLVWRLGLAIYLRFTSGPLRTWLEEIGQDVDQDSLAVRWFTRRQAVSTAAANE